MNGIRAHAHGRAAHAVLTWLHGRKVQPIALHQPIDHTAEPAPKNRDDIEERIRHVLAGAVGEMIHLGASSRHLAADRSDVRHALDLAGKLGAGDPVDRLEPVFDDLCATLRSPRIWAAVKALAGALMRAPRGEMGATEAQRVIKRAFADDRGADFSMPAHPRTIFVKPAPRAD